MKIPFRKVEATIIYKSGAKSVFICYEINVKKNTDNTLSQISTKEAKNFPLYIRLDEVVSVNWRIVYRF